MADERPVIAQSSIDEARRVGESNAEETRQRRSVPPLGFLSGIAELDSVSWYLEREDAAGRRAATREEVATFLALVRASDFKWRQS